MAMSNETSQPPTKTLALGEIRYSLADLLKEVQTEREGSSIGQEIVDQGEISKLFNRKKKARRGKAGK